MATQRVIKENPKRSKTWRLALPALCLAASLNPGAHAKEGGTSSGGSDLKPADSGVAWFAAEDRAIRVCHEASPGFGVATEEAEDAIREAFRTWGAYMSSKGLVFLFTSTPTTKLEMLASCDGTQDLKFYLGTEDEAVKEAKRQYEAPIAFAHRVSYDPGARWGKGFVWIAASRSQGRDPASPDWSVPKALHAMILHEVGHILGCDHVRGTIMDAEIAELIQSTPPGYSPPYSPASDFERINWSRELLFNLSDGGKLQGNLDQFDRAETAWIFQDLVGRPPQGEVQAIYRLKGGGHAGSLSLSDEAGSTELRVELVGSEVAVNYGGTVFKRPCFPTGRYCGSDGGAGYVRFGKLTHRDGRVSPVVEQTNSDGMDGPFVLSYFSADGKRRMAFHSFAPPTYGSND